MRNRHSDAAVQRGIDRFFADLRESLGLDVEPELSEPPMCTACGVLPAAYVNRCFSCHAKGRLPS